MKSLGLNEIRERYLKFFESKGHLRLESFPLVPVNDNSLLLINSGMAPMKKYFLGEALPPSKRVVNCQKCIRTPDIENVGKTSRHGTFFEMLGNFSFGDYFKKDAIPWAWEFFTKEMEIPEEKLYISVFLDDDEAYEIWTKEIGVPESRMVRLGREDNFWEHGSGPCGPCSEIYFDRGEENGCGRPDCAPGCDCDRFVEIWNLVFTQLDSDGKGNYTRLEKPNIDTGMGLERLACVMQGVGNLFEVDTIQNIMRHISAIAGVEYGKDERTDISLRVITDHVRSTVFMVADGILPSNEGRGYVLRRLLRRAARHGRLLGVHEEFLYKVCETVVGENLTAYPELKENQDYIVRIVNAEEARFSRTIDQGMEMLNQLIDRFERHRQEKGSKILSGEAAFKLYDTFGFPIDLTREIIAERQMALDEEGFSKLMEMQRKRAREARAKQSDTSWVTESLPITEIETVFVGYEANNSQSTLVNLILEGELVDGVQQGDECTVVLDRSPFYAESGGQVGDTGKLVSDHGEIRINDCIKTVSGVYLHNAVVVKGSFMAGDLVTAQIDVQRRQAIRRNHTSAHMLQAALRQVLGDHIHQAGSYVDDQRMRFDFNHFEAMTREEVKKVEHLVNEKILEGIPVTVNEMKQDEAKQIGALALFGEKYGDVVRVVQIPEFSTEFCGGTHVDNTAKLGLFRILSEGSVAAGVRRIEATTGWGVLETLDDTEEMLMRSANLLKLQNPTDLFAKIHAAINEAKEKDREIESLNQKLADNMVGSLLSGMRRIGELEFISASFTDGNTDILRSACDRLKADCPNAVVLLSNISGGKGVLMTACGRSAIEAGVHAGKLIKEIATRAGGSGGGKPDSAMAGFKDLDKVKAVMEAAPEVIANMLK